MHQFWEDVCLTSLIVEGTHSILPGVFSFLAKRSLREIPDRLLGKDLFMVPAYYPFTFGLLRHSFRIGCSPKSWEKAWPHNILWMFLVYKVALKRWSNGPHIGLWFLDCWDFPHGIRSSHGIIGISEACFGNFGIWPSLILLFLLVPLPSSPSQFSFDRPSFAGDRLSWVCTARLSSALLSTPGLSLSPRLGRPNQMCCEVLALNEVKIWFQICSEGKKIYIYIVVNRKASDL